MTPFSYQIVVVYAIVILKNDSLKIFIKQYFYALYSS